MPKIPSNSEQSLMTRLGFDTLEAMEEWLSKPTDPSLMAEFEEVYPDDYPDLESDDPHIPGQCENAGGV